MLNRIADLYSATFAASKAALRIEPRHESISFLGARLKIDAPEAMYAQFRAAPAAGTLWPLKSQLSASDRQYLPHLSVSAMETGPIRPFRARDTRFATQDRRTALKLMKWTARRFSQPSSRPCRPATRGTRQATRDNDHAKRITDTRYCARNTPHVFYITR